MYISEGSVRLRNTVIHTRNSKNPTLDDKPDLLLLHGWGLAGEYFKDGIRTLSPNFNNIVAPDFPGFGESFFSSPPNTPDNGAPEFGILKVYVEVIRELIEKLDLTNLIILGHSMGGIVGTLFCDEYPLLTDGFISIESPLAYSPLLPLISSLPYIQRGEFSNWLRFVSMANKMNLLPTAPTSLGDCEAAKIVLEGLKDISSARSQVWEKCCLAVQSEEDHCRIGQIYLDLKVPRLYMCGEKSPAFQIPPEYRETGLKFAEILEGGHNFILGQPGQFYQKTLQFLESIRV